MKKMNVKVLEELPDIALLDYWTGSMAMFGGCIFILFGEWIFGTLFMFLGVILLFSLEPAEYLIETVIDDEVLKAHLYRPNPCKAWIFKDDIVSGPYLDKELKLLKLDLKGA